MGKSCQTLCQTEPLPFLGGSWTAKHSKHRDQSTSLVGRRTRRSQDASILRKEQRRTYLLGASDLSTQPELAVVAEPCHAILDAVLLVVTMIPATVGCLDTPLLYWEIQGLSRDQDVLVTMILGERVRPSRVTAEVRSGRGGSASRSGRSFSAAVKAER